MAGQKKPEDFPAGQMLIMVGVFAMLYSYFYQTSYQQIFFLQGFWYKSALLAVVTVMSGILIELGRFLGGPVEVNFKPGLLIVQGIPAGILGLVPGWLWVDLFGSGYPFNFLADTAVSAAAGVWFGVVLLRATIDQKRVVEREELEQKEKRPREAF